MKPTCICGESGPAFYRQVAQCVHNVMCRECMACTAIGDTVQTSLADSQMETTLRRIVLQVQERQPKGLPADRGDPHEMLSGNLHFGALLLLKLCFQGNCTSNTIAVLSSTAVTNGCCNACSICCGRGSGNCSCWRMAA